MNIASIGNITFDILAYFNNYPIEDTRTNVDNLIYGFGGPAINASYVISKYGLNVDFYGIIGKDVFGKMIYDELHNTKININNLLIQDHFDTPLSYISISKKTDTRTINTYRDKLEKIYENNIKISNKKYDVIYTDGKYPNKFKELSRKNPNALKIIDAGRCNENIVDICKDMDYIICSLDFANDFMKYLKYDLSIDLNNQKSINTVFNILDNYFKKSNIIITLGSKGSVYKFDNEIKNILPLTKNKVVDTNAAGDIYHGAFVYAILNDFDYQQAIEFANVTSSLSVTKYGGKLSCPNLDEVEKEIIEKKGKIKRLIK